MGINFTNDEAWAELAVAHTGIFTTLKQDGWPVPLPTWFAAIDECIYFRTPRRAKKLARLRHDPRGTFLVERGIVWVELAAVMLPVRATILEDGTESDHAKETISAKYADVTMPTRKIPSAATKNYDGMTVVRLAPAGPFVSWDNSRLQLKTT